MGDYWFRVVAGAISSELCPARLRTPLMRMQGYQLSKDACIWPQGSFRSTKLRVGTGVFINIGFYHDGYDQLDIGRNVRIGAFVRVLTASHDIGPPHQRGLVEVTAAPVTIEDGSWIGACATIMPGVTVRTGCVIATGAVVTRDTEPNGLYAGIPAIRKRELDP